MDLAAVFSTIFDSETGDFKVVVKSDDDEILATFLVIGQILTTRSPVFAAMLSHDMKESSTGEAIVKGFSRDAVAAFLKYLYTNKLVASLPLALEVTALADKYEVLCLKKVASDFVNEGLDPQNACELLKMASKLSATSVAEQAIGTICRRAVDALPIAFVLEPNLLDQVLSSHQLCVTDDQLARILFTWHKNAAAKAHDVPNLLRNHVQLSSVSDSDYSKLEALAGDVGLKECLQTLRRTAKRGESTEDVFGTLYKKYQTAYPSSSRPSFLGYWVNFIPSQMDFLVVNTGQAISQDPMCSQAAGHADIRLVADGTVRWYMPHHTLFIHGVSFYHNGCNVSVPGLPEVAISSDGSTWKVILDARDTEIKTEDNCQTPARSCHYEHGVNWFQLRARANAFTGRLCFHGILVVG